MQPDQTTHPAPSAPPQSRDRDLQGTTREITSYAREIAVKHGPPAVGALLLFVVAWFFAGWARTAMRRGLSRTSFDPTLGKFFSNVLRWAIITLAAVTCLGVFGVVPTSFAAVIGAVTLAVGLGFQGSLSNLAAGVMLLTFRPFKVGDAVVVAGQPGKVNEIDLLVTELDTADGRRISIPNGQVIGAPIENITYHPRRRVEVAVGVAYAADIDQTRAALERAAKSVQPRLDDPASEVVLDELGVSSVNWKLRVWTKKEDFLRTHQSAIRAVKNALDEAEIRIPFPQMDVWVRSVPPGSAGGV